MLKLKTVTIIAIAAIIGISILLSCEKETVNTNDTTLTVTDFTKAGVIHNAFLTNVNSNFESVTKEDDLNERIETISDFNKEFVSTLDLPFKDKQILIQSLENNKELVVTAKLTEKSFSSNKLKSGDIENANIFELIEYLKSTSQINENSYDILSKLSTDLKSNYENSLSDEQLKSNIQGLISEFDNYGYDLESGEGEMVGTILAVSIASIEWWKENPEAFGDNLKSAKALPVWAAADIVGGVLGAGLSAGAQYAVNGEVNWFVVGISAVGGAVAGSTGIVGKAAKYLSKLF